jgi:hypothetical protein
LRKLRMPSVTNNNPDNSITYLFLASNLFIHSHNFNPPYFYEYPQLNNAALGKTIYLMGEELHLIKDTFQKAFKV